MPQKYKTSSGSLEQATQNNPALKQVLQSILNWQGNFVDVSGIDPHVPAGTVNSNSLQPPPIVDNMSVIGLNGRFIINITPPSGILGVLYYLVESSTTLPFESSTSLIQYGPSTNITFEVTQPEQTRNWRVRCKFTNSSYSSNFSVNNVFSGSITGYSSVIDFGAFGDGIHDDTNAIQAAASSGAGHVYFPKGSYLTSSITWPSSVHMVTGDGINASNIIAFGSITSGSPFWYFGPRTGLIVEDLSFNVSKTTYSTNIVLYFDGLSEVLTNNLKFDAAGRIAVYCHECVDGYIERSFVFNFSQIGILSDGVNSKRISVNECGVIGPGSSHNVQLKDGVDLKILNSYSEMSAQFGFNMQGVLRGLIDKCTSVDSLIEGINFESCNSGKITNNEVYWNDTGSGFHTRSTDFGISVFGNISNCDYTLVAFNKIKRCAKSAIAFAAVTSVANCLTIGNIIESCNFFAEAQGAGVLLYGTPVVNTQIIGNVIGDTSGNMRYGVNEWDDGASGVASKTHVFTNQITDFLVDEVAFLNTLSTTDAWRTLNPAPSITSGTGTITTKVGSMRFRVDSSRMCSFLLNISITTNGSASQSVNSSIPYAGSIDPNGFAGFASGRENNVTGKMLQGLIGASDVKIFTYDNIYPGADGARMFLSGSYKIS